MDSKHRLLELKRKYLGYIDDITELQHRLAQEEVKLFQCQEEMRQLNFVMTNGNSS